MDLITTDQLREAVHEHNIIAWDIRTCSICGHPVRYLFDGINVAFDSNCDCTSYPSIPQQHTWEDFADTFNRQKPEVRARLWNDFIESGQSGDQEIYDGRVNPWD